MDRTIKRVADGLLQARDRDVIYRSGGFPTNPETTLAGTWPSMLGQSSADDLRHVAAVDTVMTSLTSPRRRRAWPKRSWGPVPGFALRGRGDSQGRMDLMTILAQKAKDFVNAAIVRERQLLDAMWHPRS